MTSINAGLSSYAQLGSAYTRAAATQQPSLAGILNAADSGNPLDGNAATNLTLSDAARAQLAGTVAQKDFSTVTSDARTALDGLYAAAKVKGPIDADGKTDDRPVFVRSPFAVCYRHQQWRQVQPRRTEGGQYRTRPSLQ
jgi:hypothetical protein